MHVEPGPAHRIALVGATGRIGRAVARMLAGAGADFRALSRDGCRATRTLGPHARVIEGDLADPSAVADLVRGADRLLIVCSEPSLERCAVAAAEAAGVRRVVKISAAGPGGECAAEHADAEDAVRRSGLAWTILRPTALMQTLADAIAHVAREGVVRLPAGEAPVGWVDARDVAAVALHALLEDQHAGATWTVSGPEAISVARAVEIVSHAIGRPLRYLALDPEAAEGELRTLGVAAARVGSIVECSARWRSGALATTTDVVRRIARVEPRTFARFAATHDFGLDVERGPRSATA